MATRLLQKLSAQDPSAPLAARCYGQSLGCNEDDILTVHESDARTHTLLWSRFISTHHFINESEERLVFVFLGSQVVVGGLVLGRLVEASKKHRLNWLRSLPAAYRAQRMPNETFVDFLAVVNDAPHLLPHLSA